MASLTNRRLRLGLVVSGPLLGVPPILSLMAKARWQSGSACLNFPCLR